jgi:hypothetical protein
MSADRVNLPTPTSPGSTPGAAGFSAATSAASTSAAPPPQQPLGAARATDPAATAPAAAAVALRLRAMLPQVDPELAAPVAQASAATPLADLKREVERILSPRDDGDGAAATADENAGKYQGKLGKSPPVSRKRPRSPSPPSAPVRRLRPVAHQCAGDRGFAAHLVGPMAVGSPASPRAFPCPTRDIGVTSRYFGQDSEYIVAAMLCACAQPESRWLVDLCPSIHHMTVRPYHIKVHG